MCFEIQNQIIISPPLKVLTMSNLFHMRFRANFTLIKYVIKHAYRNQYRMCMNHNNNKTRVKKTEEAQC